MVTITAKQTGKRNIDARIAQPRVLEASRLWIWVCLVIIQGICSYLIIRWEPEHTRSVPAEADSLTGTRGDTAVYTRTSQLHLPESLVVPTATMFVNAVLVFGISVLLSHGLRESDLYQDRLVMAGILCGLVPSAFMAIRDGAMLPFKDIMPGVITVTLVISAMVHNYQNTFGI